MKYRKTLATTLALLLVLLVTSTAAAGIAQPLFTHIREACASLSISGSTAYCLGEVIAHDSSASCSVTVTLQKKSDTSWTKVKAWTATGTGSACADKTYTVSSGSYRVKVVAQANGESTTIYSNVKTK